MPLIKLKTLLVTSVVAATLCDKTVIPWGPNNDICIAPIKAINVSFEQILDVALCLLICCSRVERVRVNANF